MICTAPAALACSRQALQPAAAKHYNWLHPSTLRGAHGRTRLVVLPMNPPARTTCELRRGAQGKGACARACGAVLDLHTLAAGTGTRQRLQSRSGAAVGLPAAPRPLAHLGAQRQRLGRPQALKALHAGRGCCCHRHCVASGASYPLARLLSPSRALREVTNPAAVRGRLFELLPERGLSAVYDGALQGRNINAPAVLRHSVQPAPPRWATATWPAGAARWCRG